MNNVAYAPKCAPSVFRLVGTKYNIDYSIIAI